MALADDPNFDPQRLLEMALAVMSEQRRDGVQPPNTEELARAFPDLEIFGLVGTGGMGAVYRVQEAESERTLALKVLPKELAADPAFAERFALESRSHAALDHENIVRVHDHGERDGYLYLLSDFVDGTNLRQLIEMGSLAATESVRLVRQVCAGLQCAHDRGIVHRDIKPENILVDQSGRVRIADFGLAKLPGRDTDLIALTHTKQALGTPHYMAPEQLAGSAAIDHRVDIYSTGVVLYELLTGRLPVGHFAKPSLSTGVDRRLDAIVLRALAQEPGERFAQARELGDALTSITAQWAGARSELLRWVEFAATVATLCALIALLINSVDEGFRRDSAKVEMLPFVVIGMAAILVVLLLRSARDIHEMQAIAPTGKPPLPAVLTIWLPVLIALNLLAIGIFAAPAAAIPAAVAIFGAIGVAFLWWQWRVGRRTPSPS